MQACTQWTHSDVWSQLATTPECLFTIGDRQSEKEWRNSDRRAICNATRGIDTGRWQIRLRGVSDGSDRARPLWRSHSARTEMFFPDVGHSGQFSCLCVTVHFRDIFVFIGSNAASFPTNILLLAWANCLIMSFSCRVPPVVCDFLQPMTSHRREKLASTPTPCGMRENMSRATLEWSAYFECVSSYCHHQSVISSIENVMLISIGWEW